MDTYYFVIYYRGGRKTESGLFSGVASEISCERAAQMEFDRMAKFYENQPQWAPTRWEVRKR